MREPKSLEDIYLMAGFWARKRRGGASEEDREDFASFAAIRFAEGLDRRYRMRWLWADFRNASKRDAMKQDRAEGEAVSEDQKRIGLAELPLTERLVAGLVLRGFRIAEIAELSESSEQLIGEIYGEAAAHLSKN